LQRHGLLQAAGWGNQLANTECYDSLLESIQHC